MLLSETGIVNAANSSLDHASGLAGAITKKGYVLDLFCSITLIGFIRGPRIQAESDAYIAKNGRLEDGDVAVTTAGLLLCKSVIHAVGPTWRGGTQGEELLLQLAVRNCLSKAAELGYKSIALPAISSGIFGFPKVRPPFKRAAMCLFLPLTTLLFCVPAQVRGMHV